MKIAGLGGGGKIEPNKWYLLEISELVFRNIGQKHPKAEVHFTVADGPHAGKSLVDDFLLSVKAITRLRKMLSEAGYDQQLLASDELDPDAVVGLRVWAKIKESEYGLVTDGWNFRPLSDPPAEEKAIDYAKQDSADAFAGL